MDAQAITIKDKPANVVMEMINRRTGKIKMRKAILKQKKPYRTLFQKAHTTRIINSDIKLNQGLKDSDFTVEKLIPLEKRKEK